MDIGAFIAKWWIEWALGLIATGLVTGFRILYKRQKQAEAKQAAIESGMRAILRDRIVTAYYHYSDRKTITLHGLENIEHMYKSYSALGGNGTVPHLVEYMRELEVVDE